MTKAQSPRLVTGPVTAPYCPAAVSRLRVWMCCYVGVRSPGGLNRSPNSGISAGRLHTAGETRVPGWGDAGRGLDPGDTGQMTGPGRRWTEDWSGETR